MSLSVIQAEVGDWSRNNFGDQVSKATHQVLGSLSPLLGIVEEFGELALAYIMRARLESDDPDNHAQANAIDAEISDALADCMVYALDYAEREGDMSIEVLINLNAEAVMSDDSHYEIMLYAQKTIGRLCHVTLKRHQGIRGFDDYEKYRICRDHAIAQLMTIIDIIAISEGLILEEILQATWDKVKSRNWKARPVDANEHQVV